MIRTIVVLHDNKVNTAPAPAIIALQALGHVAGDADLGPRFLALSGLDADGLRAGAGDPAVLAALVDFLAQREADLVSTADAIGVKPEALVRAGMMLGGGA